MTLDKQTQTHARSLFKLCFSDGVFSDERASAVLATLEKNPPRRYATVLRLLLQLVRRELSERTALVEHAGELSQASIAELQASFSSLYGKPIEVVASRNDSLIAGLRARVGCDLYERSVSGSLRELQASLS